jgi:prevent-host-death family protein
VRVWNFQEAQANLHELLREAERSGPQSITWHDRDVAVVVSKAEYERLSHASKSLPEFMRSSPLYSSYDIEFVRDTSSTREAAL